MYPIGFSVLGVMTVIMAGDALFSKREKLPWSVVAYNAGITSGFGLGLMGGWGQTLSFSVFCVTFGMIVISWSDRNRKWRYLAVFGWMLCIVGVGSSMLAFALDPPPETWFQVGVGVMVYAVVGLAMAYAVIREHFHPAEQS